MSRKVVWMLGLLGMFYGVPASALGLGGIEVSSGLNQPFSAVITLYAVSADDTGNLQVQAAPASDFQKAGIQRSNYVSTLRFKVSGGRVQVSSDQAINEPFLNLLVEAQTPAGRVLRTYTILFDPPPAQAAAPVAQAAPVARAAFFQTDEERTGQTGSTARAVTAVAPAPASASRLAATAPLARAVAVSTKSASTFGPVRPEHTFWRIATQLRPSETVSMDQTMLAIYSLNPDAFVRFDRLKVGSLLRVPSEDQMRAVSVEEARRRVKSLRSGSEVAAKTAPVAKIAEPKKLPTVVAAKTPEPKAPVVVAAPALAPAPQPVVVAAAAPQAVVAETRPAVEAEKASSRSAPLSLDEQASAAQAMDGDTADRAPVPIDAPSSLGEPVPVAPVGPLTLKERIEPYKGVLLAGAIIFVLISFMMLLRWRRQEATYRRDSLSDYLRPGPPFNSGNNAWPTNGAADKTSDRAPAPPPTQRLEPVFALPPVAAPEFEDQDDEPVRVAPAAEPVADEQAAPWTARTEPVLHSRPPLEMPDEEMDLESAPNWPGVFDPITPPAEAPVAIDSPVEPAGEPALEPVIEPVVVPAADPAANQAADLALAEADFNLSFGLYDEAISGLQEAQELNPGRLDLSMKLAEVYAAAGRSADFQASPELSLPAAPIVEAPEPEAQPAEASVSHPEPLEPAPESPEEPISPTRREASFEPLSGTSSESRLDNGVGPPIRMRFQLRSEGAPEARSESKPGHQPDQRTPPQAELRLEPVIGSLSPRVDSSPSESAKAPAVTHSSDNAPHAGGHRGLEPTVGVVNSDYAAIKLDLARAYIHISDFEMARNLLVEVSEQGTPVQQSEARTMLQGIPG